MLYKTRSKFGQWATGKINRLPPEGKEMVLFGEVPRK